MSRRTRRILAAMTLMATASMAITSCAATPSSAGGTPSAEEVLKITFVSGNLPNPFYHSLYAGAAKKAKELGNIELTMQGAADFEASAQTRVLDAVLTTQPHAVIVAPVSETAVTPTLSKFHAAGIPIVTVDGAIKDDSIITSALGANHYAGGEAAADAMAEAINGKGTVGVFAINPGVPATNLRAGGFMDRIAAKYPDIKVLDLQYTEGSLSKSQSTADSLMAANPGLNGFFASEFWSTSGIATALKTAGKTDSVALIGYDALPAEVDLIKDGSVHALVVQPPFALGEMAMQAAYDALTGKGDKITKKVELDNVIMTRENMSDPGVADLVYQVEQPPVG
jgi:ribose transport system substrate-binding protein